jgi:hypothetical protein
LDGPRINYKILEGSVSGSELLFATAVEKTSAIINFTRRYSKPMF